MLRQMSETQHQIPVISNPPVHLFSPLYTRTYIHEPPFRHSAVGLLINACLVNSSAVFLEEMRGAIAGDLKGFVFTVGSDDHPAALLNSDPIAAPLGEIKVVKLSLQLVC